MKPHVKIYMDYHGYAPDEYISCEVCDQERAVDVAHIEPKGMGGRDSVDKFENLIGLGRKCHDKAHASIYSKDFLRERKKW